MTILEALSYIKLKKVILRADIKMSLSMVPKGHPVAIKWFRDPLVSEGTPLISGHPKGFDPLALDHCDWGPLKILNPPGTKYNSTFWDPRSPFRGVPNHQLQITLFYSYLIF